MLKSDQQGFLIGEVLDVSKEMLGGQKAGLQSLSRIEASVAGLVGRGRRSYGGSAGAINAVPAAVEASSRRSGLVIPSGGAIAASSRTVAVAAVSKLPMRDGSGRFVKGSGASKKKSGSREGDGDDPKSPDEARISSENRVVEAIKETAAMASDRMDPMVEAAKEVWEPLGRGWRASFGQSAEKKKERWYKRIWQALTRKKKDEEANVVGGGGRSGGGFMSGLGRVLGGRGPVGWVGRMATGLLGGAAGMLGRGLSGARGLLGKAGAGLLGGAAGLLKRIPSLGGIGGALGRIAPTLMGAIPRVLGRVFGPVAALWGAWDIGQWIGGKIHDWLVSSGMQDKMFAWIDSMRAGWSSMIDRISTTWDSMMKGLSEFWKTKIKDPVANAVDATKEAAGKVYNAGIDLLNGGVKTFAEGAAATNTWIQEKTGLDVGAAVKSAASTAGGALGDLIGRHEGGYDSFNRGRAGDSRRKSMDFSSMTVSEIMALQSLPKNDPRRLFAVGKYQVVPDTMKEAVSFLGIDGSEKFTPELQERMFRQFLIGKKRPAVDAYINGKSDDIQKAAFQLSQEFASVANPLTGFGYYDGKAGNKASISVDQTYAALRSMRAQSVNSSATTVSVPSILNSGSMQAIGAAPDVAFPSMSGSNERPIQISLQDQIGQNVSDRAIAHITSGGLGMF